MALVLGALILGAGWVEYTFNLCSAQTPEELARFFDSRDAELAKKIRQLSHLPSITFDGKLATYEAKLDFL